MLDPRHVRLVDGRQSRGRVCGSSLRVLSARVREKMLDLIWLAFAAALEVTRSRSGQRHRTTKATQQQRKVHMYHESPESDLGEGSLRSLGLTDFLIYRDL